MSQTNKALQWALIGASDIAKTRMIQAINAQTDSRVAAVFSANPERAKAYAAENGIPEAYDELDKLLGDPAIDVVYISTTNELHRDQAIAAAASGKHILCEKPLALSLGDTKRCSRPRKPLRWSWELTTTCAARSPTAPCAG
jgi:1,5-anhydro-D-fructose reductase (1,5-anhydro-D-mannitol-forming)